MGPANPRWPPSGGALPAPNNDRKNLGPHPTTPVQLGGLSPASIAPSLGPRGGVGKGRDLKPKPSFPQPLLKEGFLFVKLLFKNPSSAYLVRTNESDKYWKEYRRRCGLGTLSKVAYNCIVGLLRKRGWQKGVSLAGRRSPGNRRPTESRAQGQRKEDQPFKPQ